MEHASDYLISSFSDPQAGQMMQLRCKKQEDRKDLPTKTGIIQKWNCLDGPADEIYIEADFNINFLAIPAIPGAIPYCGVFVAFERNPELVEPQGPSGLPIRCRFHLHAEAGAKCCGGNEPMHWHDTNLKGSKSHNHHTTTGFFQPDSFHFH